MAFYVDISQRDVDYLHQQLTPAGFERLHAEIASLFQNCSDSFREERRLPVASATSVPSTYFELTQVFPDGDQIHIIRFIVNDSGAVYGVLQIVFVDCESQASP